MRRRYIVLIAAAVAALGVGLWQTRKLTQAKQSVPVETPQPQVAEAVAALGTLEPDGEILQLAAPTMGVQGAPRIARLYVKEGDTVSTGQVLAEFDNRSSVLADLEELEISLESLDAQIVLQKRELNRYASPAASGAVSLVQIEDQQVDLILLQTEKRESLAKRKGLLVDLEKTQLLSPIDGQVLKIHSRVGERPNEDGVLEVGDSFNMQARIEVYESDVNKLRIGDPVTLTSENGGFKNSLNGEVLLIRPQVEQREVLSTDPTADADARVIEVLVSLKPADAKRVSHLSGLKVIARFEQS